MNPITTKTIIGTLLPFASNPVVLTVVGIGAAAWAFASIFDDDTEGESNGSSTAENRSEPSKKPLKRNRSTVQSTALSTARKPLETPETTVATEDGEPLTPALPTEEVDTSANLHMDNTAILDNEKAFSVEAISMDDEAAQKEMIRKTMSELGKRSGAARRKAKIDRNAVPE